MLKYLRVKNFLSFKEDTIISFESSNYGGKAENVFDIKSNGKKTTIAKSMIIYGANASGKTNILKTIDLIKDIATSTSSLKFKNFLVPFLLDLNSPLEPIFFEICFFVENKQYIFNFEILENKIITENLIEVKTNNNIVNLYNRINQKIKYDKSFEKEAKKGLEKMKENISFFAVLSQWNGMLNNKPIDYFFEKLNIFFSNNIRPGATIGLLDLTKNDDNKKLVIEFLKCADINIDDIEINQIPLPEVFKDAPKELIDDLTTEIKFGHKINHSNEIKYFSIKTESAGTQKLFYILGPIIDSIINEKILFIDEVETNLHTHILKNLFKLIHSKIDKKYQFIFTTHNIELMSLSMFKKEQIGIVKKNKENISSFYTLYDFDEIPLRSENDIKKLYNLGILGGTPFVGDFSVLLNDLTKLGDQKSNDE